MKTLASRHAVFAASVFAVLATSNCGGGNIPKVTGVAAGNIAGIAVKGPVAAGTVKIYKLSPSMERGDELAAGSTDAAGAFSLPLTIYNGPLLVVISSGTYVEESIGLGVKLDGHELTALIADYKGGTKIEGLRATPISTIAVAFTTFHVVHDKKTIADAHSEAILHLHKQFGDIDWATVSPADISVAGVTNLSPEAKAGLVLSGLSWESKVHAETSGVTAGLSLNAATLMSALVKDASDGTLDGKAGGDALKQGTVGLTGAATRVDLVQGITGFINSSRNASSLTLADIAGFVAGIGGSNDAYLFCPGQLPSAECGSGLVDTIAPTVTWHQPTRDGVGIAGSVKLRVSAEDETKLKSLRFTSPEALKGVVATFDGRRAELATDFDVSALPDGPLTIRAEAADGSGNPSAQSMTVVVSNKGPRITINGPGTVVKDAVVLTATAQAQAIGGSIISLTLVDPPRGLGEDTLASADSYSATWDTRQAPEGHVVLTFRAIDNFNSQTESSVTVSVDNVVFGTVRTVATLGAPVGGLQMKLLAIDPATGLPVIGRVGGAVLGDSESTLSSGMSGAATFMLSQENYDGPVQLVATGAAASYVDPSDGTSSITLPSTFSLSSYVARYRSGETLDVPLTGWTTLADAAALSFLQGKNPSSQLPSSLSTALQVVDPLFSSHLTRATEWKLRGVYPVSMTSNPQSLRDVVYAAFPDVGLNRLARDLATSSGLTPGSGFAAPQLIEALLQDIRDGQFDGKSSGAQLMTGGTTPYSYDANTTRLRLAIAMDAFVSSSANKTGIRRVDCQTSGLFDTISNDTSILYASSQAPIPFDNTPPGITVAVTFANGGSSAIAPVEVGASKIVAGVLAVDASAGDASGVASLSVVVNESLALAPAVVPTPSRYVGTFDTTALADGEMTVTATACDAIGSCTSVRTIFIVDNTKPNLAIVKPVAGSYSAVVEVDASASDANGMLTLMATGLPGLVDEDALATRLLGSWSPGTTLDGPLSIGLTACDVVHNCQTKGVSSVVLDRTPPTVTWKVVPPSRVRTPTIVVTVEVADALSGVQSVWMKGSGSPVAAIKGIGSWSATVPLDVTGAATSVTAWALDTAIPPNSGQSRGIPNEATASITYDGAPPVVVFVATYAAADGSTQSPLGTEHLLGGTVTVTVDATDPSGVGALSLAVDGVPMAPGAGTTTQHFVGSYATGIDGAHGFSATATDALGNVGTSPYAFVVDNAAPIITVSKPTVGYYSLTVDVLANAVDAHSITGLTAAGFTGLIDLDIRPEQFVANAYLLPAGEDGTKTVTFTSCDSIRNCRSAAATINVDRTPPVLTVLTAPPRYTNSATIDFAVRSSDPAGTKAVHAQRGTAAIIDGVSDGAGKWSFTSVPIADGNNALRIWAEDLASPSNTSSGTTAQIGVDVTRDGQAPVSTLETAASYIDERSLTLLTSSPVTYGYAAGATKVSIGPAAHIYKAITRLSYGATAPTPAELDGANSNNVPFLRFGVQYADAEAPIKSAEMILRHAGCPTCPVAVLPAIQGARRADQIIPLYVPITREVLPSLLTQARSPITLEVSVRVTDEANNVGTTAPTTVSFHIIGPPVEVTADAAYSSAADVRSIYGYRLSNGTYHVTWSPSGPVVNDATGSHNSIRVVRFVLKNPHGVPVAVPITQTNLAYSLSETWNGEVFAHPRSETVDGMVFNRDEIWGEWDQIPVVTRHPCAAGGVNAQRVFNQVAKHFYGTTTRFNCMALPYPVADSTAPFVMAGGPVAIVPFKSAQVGGGERTIASTISDLGGSAVSYVLVPAGESIAVYAERPVDLSRFGFDFDWGTHTSSTSAYRHVVYDFYRQLNGQLCEGGMTCGGFQFERYSRRLDTAAETMTGSVSFGSSAVYTDGRAYGDVRDLGSFNVNTSYSY